jgi:hypothetical protein
MSRSAYVVAGFTVICLAAALLWPPMPQPLAYHAFVDHRAFLGVPNFFDVASNVGFIVPGVVGLIIVWRAHFERPIERLPYVVFFIALLLTSFGSAYYHLAPDNERLFWDRLPMTIAFMSLIAAQIVERISIRAGVALLAPMLLIGAGSAVYWRATERASAGNVIPYGIMQGYSVVILLLLAVLLPSRYTRERDIYWVFGYYVLAKILEAADAHIFALGHFVSGHALKHLAAGAAGLVVCRMLTRRTLKSESEAQILRASDLQKD